MPQSRLQSESVPRLLSYEARALPGTRRIITLPNPAVATDWSFTAPAGTMIRPLLAVATLNTSAVVANRTAGVQIVDTDRTWWRAGGGTLAAASQSGTAFYGNALLAPVPTTLGQFFNLPLPSIILPTGFSIGSFTPTIQAGDQWTGVAIMVEQIETTDQLMTDEYLERVAYREVREALDVAADLSEIRSRG